MSRNARDFSLDLVEAGRKERLGLELAEGPAGPICINALVARGRAPGKCIVVIGGVHGDEFEGPLTVLKVFEGLDPNGMSGSFIGVPVVNPPAFLAGTRSSPLDGQNLARVFPGSPCGTISERIAHALLEHVFPHGDLLLDHHSGGVNYACPLTCGYYLLEGEIGRISKEAAQAFGADFVWGSPLNQGRTISEAVRHKQIPSIYTETTGGGGVLPDDLDAYARGTRNVMRALGILSSESEGSGGDPQGNERGGDGSGTRAPILLESDETNRDFDRAINATQSGLFEARVRAGERVRKGQVLGVIYGLDGTALEEVRSDRDGYVMGIRRFNRIFSGELVGLVA